MELQKSDDLCSMTSNLSTSYHLFCFIFHHKLLASKFEANSKRLSILILNINLGPIIAIHINQFIYSKN